MTDTQTTSAQAVQGSGSQGSSGQSQSLGDQLYGAQAAQQGNQQATQQQQSTQAAQAQPIIFDDRRAGETVQQYVDRLKGTLKSTNAEAAKWRNQVRALAGEEGAGNQGAQGAQHNGVPNELDQRIATLERELNQERQARKGERLTTALTGALSTAGAVNVARAVMLIPPTELVLDTSGAPTAESITAAISKLKAEMPMIFTDTVGNGDGGAGNAGAGEAEDFNAQIRRRAGR